MGPTEKTFIVCSSACFMATASMAALKMMGFIDWSWLWVMLPSCMPMAIIGSLLLLFTELGILLLVCVVCGVSIVNIFHAFTS